MISDLNRPPIKSLNMLWKLRVLGFYLVLSIFTIVCYFTIALPTEVFFRAARKLASNRSSAHKKEYNIKYKMAESFSSTFIWIAKIFGGLNYRVEGLEKLPPVPSIVLSNHQSFWENIFMQLIIPKHSWVIKKELLDIPFFGWGLKMMSPISVDRSMNHSILQIIREGQKKLKRDQWIVMFPESTRLRPEQSTKFKPSAAKLALAAKVPIVLMVHNAGVYWPKGFWLTQPGTIKVKIVKVIPVEEAQQLDTRELTDHIEQIINSEKQALLVK